MSEETGAEPLDLTLEAPSTDAQLRLLAVSAMTPIVVHELMRPLSDASNHIAAASRHLKDRKLPPELVRAIDQSGAAVTRAVDIVGSMKSFVLTGAVRAHTASLREIVERARRGLPVEMWLDIDLEVDLQPDAEIVRVNDLLIELVLNNLLVNAIEAAQPAQAHVFISARRLEDKVVMAVSDAGHGMTEEVHANLFKPLFTTKAGGSGLGLALCKVIVEAHGGQLWASPPGSDGAIFCMTLPAAAGGSD